MKVRNSLIAISCFIAVIGFLRTGEVFALEGASAVQPPDTVGVTDTADVPSKTRSKEAYKIQIADKLKVKIYPEDEYIKGGDVEVSSEGTISLSLIGRVQVEGLNLIEAEKRIVEILAEDYFVNPVVIVELADIQKNIKAVAILGQVAKPGSYEFPPGKKLTLLQLISMAGGFTDVANASKLKVIRKEKDGSTRVIQANAQSIIAGKESDIELEPDDVIHVSESFF
ncbi:MAG: polysaccharide export protein [Candidatus Omnitrophica bacterium]|nr:polysaccharide export protein [Candidatus Omnitrophota bacterium]